MFSTDTRSRYKINFAKGSWALPGGHLEFGESFETCALREVAEETGIDIHLEEIEYLTTVNSVWQKDELHYITIFMACYISGDVVAQVHSHSIALLIDSLTRNFVAVGT